MQKEKCPPISFASKSSSARVLVVRQKVSVELSCANGRPIANDSEAGRQRAKVSPSKKLKKASLNF